MTVTFMAGFEAGNVALDANGGALGGTFAYSTTQARTGLRSLRLNPTSGNNGWIAGFPGGATYMHFGLYVASLPTVDRAVFGDAASTAAIGLRLTPAGALAVYSGGTSGTLIGTSSAAFATPGWHWVGVRCVVGTSVVFLQIDGVAEVTGTAAANVGNSTTLGFHNSEASAVDAYVDDIIVDSAGFLAPSKVDMLMPTADSARSAGWVTGAGGTTSLFAAVDNTPPTGAADPGTATSQIRNATAEANGSYDATMETYTAVGVATGDTVLAVQPVISTAAPVTTSAKQGTVGVVSNPTIANVALGAGGTAGAFWSGAAAAAFPTGWKASFGTLTTSPSVTLGTAPVMRVTQVTSSTRIADVAFMGIQIAWTPAASTPKAGTDSATGSDASAMTANGTSRTDAGVGADASAATASYTATDAAAATDTSIKGLPVTDSGVGSDAPAIIGQAYSVTDAATGADTSTPAASLSLTDTAAGTEVSTETAANTRTDAGSGAEAPGLVGQLYVVIDAATGADLSALTTVNARSESATGGDVSSGPVASFSVVDAAAGTEASAQTSTASVTDAGSGADVAIKGVVGVDSATAVDSSLQSATATGTDTATGSDASTPAATYQLTDTGTSTDITSSRGIVSTDAGAGTDVSIVVGSGNFVRADSATGTDVSLHTAAQTRTDAGVGTEVATQAATQNPVDSGSGADASLQASVQSGSDAGVGTDASLAAAALTRTDAASGSEFSAVVQGNDLFVADSATGVEGSGVLAVLSVVSDSGHGTDVANVGFGITAIGLVRMVPMSSHMGQDANEAVPTSTHVGESAIRMRKDWHQ